MPGYPCCCGKAPCACDCPNCADVEGQEPGTKNAPCCWRITIQGMEENGCGSCDDLNGEYHVRQNADNECRWSNSCLWWQSCDPEEVSLEVIEDGGDYKIRVTLGGHVWEKHFGASKPQCCRVSHVLPHVTSSGNCDSTSATCTISYTTQCGSLCCEDCCLDGAAPDTLLVKILDLAPTAGGSRYCDCIGPVTLRSVGPCEWRDSDPECFYTGMRGFRAHLSCEFGTYRLRVSCSDYYTMYWEKEWSEKPDCMNWSDLELELKTTRFVTCTFGNLLVSAHAPVQTPVMGHGAAEILHPCDDCGSTAPDEVEVTIDMIIGERYCATEDCHNLNGSYILSRETTCGSVFWKLEDAVTVCGKSWHVSAWWSSYWLQWNVTLYLDRTNTYNSDWFEFRGTSKGALYLADCAHLDEICSVTFQNSSNWYCVALGSPFGSARIRAI